MKDKIQVYINECNDDLIKTIFNGNSEYAFRHKDCPLVFVTDGSFLYAEDIDEQGIDPLEGHDTDVLQYSYNDFNEFINEYKRIETILGHELFVSDWFNEIDTSIRQLELNYLGSR